MRRVYRWLARTLIWEFKREEALSLGEEGLRLLGEDTSLEAALMSGMIGSAQYFQGHTKRGRESYFAAWQWSSSSRTRRTSAGFGGGWVSPQWRPEDLSWRSNWWKVSGFSCSNIQTISPHRA